MNEEQLRRLSDCEVHIKRYHDKVNDLLAKAESQANSVIRKNEFQKIMDDFNARLNRDFGMIRKDVLALKEENKQISQCMVSNFDDHLGKIVRNHDRINCQLFHVEQLLKDMKLSQIDHEYHKKDLSNLKIKSENFDKNSQAIVENLLKMQKLNDRNSDSIKEMDKKHSEVLNNIDQERKHSDKALMSWVQQSNKTIEDKISAFEKKFEGYRQEQLSSINSAITQFKQKVDSLPKPVPQIPQVDITPKLDAFKKEILDAQNSSTLDISNAKAKSDVNEMQLKLMDKKLENIYLLLKKYDLTK